jgi:molybdenum cofactor biosynthesis enzyme MoaA
MRDDLPHLVKALRDGGARRIDLETNGRRLVYPNYVRALAAAGVDVLRVKLFGADAATWDAHTRAPGSFAQTVEGLAFAARFAPSIRLTAVIVPRDEQGARMKELVALATQLGFDHVSVQLRLAQHDLLGLDALLESVSAITTLASESPREGPRVSISVE